jgi:hypothetical protein
VRGLTKEYFQTRRSRAAAVVQYSRAGPRWIAGRRKRLPAGAISRRACSAERQRSCGGAPAVYAGDLPSPTSRDTDGPAGESRFTGVTSTRISRLVPVRRPCIRTQHQPIRVHRQYSAWAPRMPSDEQATLHRPVLRSAPVTIRPNRFPARPTGTDATKHTAAPGPIAQHQRTTRKAFAR